MMMYATYALSTSCARMSRPYRVVMHRSVGFLKKPTEIEQCRISDRTLAEIETG